MPEPSFLHRLPVFLFSIALVVMFVAGTLNLRAVQERTLHVGGGEISIEILDGPFSVGTDALVNWIETGARAVTAYYGKFPVPRVRVAVNAFDGDGVRSGTTDGRNGEATISISVGRSTTARQLQEDWMITHEMVHLAFPSVNRAHHWIEEGIATYVEPWARIRIGNLTPEKVWGDLVRDMPQGLPESGDQGLDRTHTWGRTYWGGALFCLVADIEIHERTSSRKGFQDALRAINRSGSILDDWDLEKALELGDKATGTGVLENLYQRMANHPFDPDLDRYWRDLGVRLADRDRYTVTLDDSAPLAAARKDIESGSRGRHKRKGDSGGPKSPPRNTE